jgi:hypothetical protein
MTTEAPPSEWGVRRRTSRPSSASTETRDAERPAQGDTEQERQARRPRWRDWRPPFAWPLWALLVLYPVWWAMGLGSFIYQIVAVPMALFLLRRQVIVRVPPGFGIWLFFMLWTLAGIILIKVNPPGTFGDSGTLRYLAVGLRMSWYLSVTVILLYVGNLTEQQLPRKALVRWLSITFLATVAGGFLGMLFPKFGFTSPVEFLLPDGVAKNNYVKSLVHPNAAQTMFVLGYEAPRPAAPFGYTNTWGNNFSTLMVWFIVGWWVFGGPKRRIATAILLALALVPAVYSLNRGMWLGIAFAAVYIAFRLALRGRLWVVGGLSLALTTTALVFALSPLQSILTERLSNGHSNRIRQFTTEQSLEVARYSPIIGLGTTRNAEGSAQSITRGKSDSCQRCGNPTLGSNGQIWLLLIANGFVGVVLYYAFFAYGAIRYRGDVTPIGVAGVLILLMSLLYNFYYNALVTPLAFTMIAYGLLWRNDVEHARISQRVDARRRLRRIRGRVISSRDA